MRVEWWWGWDSGEDGEMGVEWWNGEGGEVGGEAGGVGN